MRVTSAETKRVLVFYPAFNANDAAELTDQFHRVMWYAYPVIDRIDRIVMAVAPSIAPGELPDYLDSSITTLVEKFRPLISFVPVDKLDDELKHAHHILHWKTTVELPEAQAAGSVEDVDRHSNLEECQVYLNLSSKIGESYSLDVPSSFEKFKELVAKARARKCYIFGTGPNLSDIAEHNFDDGVSIACNSMVRNEKLLDRLKPPLIVAGDPIFHAGASSYAAEFRSHLYKSMARFNAYFLTNQRDYRIFKAHMPEELRARLIGAPADWGLRANLQPEKEFVFTACPNILTLYLIPLASSLSTEEIWIAGCDGRPLAENNYFWKHDKSVQFNDKMGDIQRAHPSFFDISYDDYYDLHCETVSHWLKFAERHGRRIVNMTPSFIPALSKRDRSGLVGQGQTQAVEQIPFAIQLRMKRVFLERQWRVLRRGILPRFKSALSFRLKRLIGASS